MPTASSPRMITAKMTHAARARRRVRPRIVVDDSAREPRADSFSTLFRSPFCHNTTLADARLPSVTTNVTSR